MKNPVRKSDSEIIKFGENIPGYDIPVLNEREIRAAAGILFLMMLIAVMMVIFRGNFGMLKYAVTIFLTDIVVRVFINPAFSPFLILGKLIVRNQAPEYVGAPQKKFAWMIGVVLATTIFILLVIVNSYSPVTGIICLVCLTFLFFESAFGICLGCKFYSLIYKEKALYCPGETCETGSKHQIQRTSRLQILIVVVFVSFVFLEVILLNNDFGKEPQSLFRNQRSMQEINN